MLSTNQTIFILAFCALIVLIAVTYHWPKIVRAFADPPPKATEPEGIADFKAEDWAHFEKFSPEVAIWKPLDEADVVRVKGDAYAVRDGMCRECFHKIEAEQKLFFWDVWIHFSCAVDLISGVRNGGKRDKEWAQYMAADGPLPDRAAMSAKLSPPPLTDAEVVKAIRGNGRPKPPPGGAGIGQQRRPPPDTGWIQTESIPR